MNARQSYLVPLTMWQARVDATPDRTFLQCGGQSWTFGEFDLLKQRLAGALEEIGIGRETRVIVAMSNRAETVLAQRAIEQLGAVMVPILPELALEEVVYQVNHCGASYAIVDDPVQSLLLEALERCPKIEHVISLDGTEAPRGNSHAFEEMLAHDGLAPRQLGDHDDLSLWSMLYTSGSTGRPKAVMLPAGAMLSGGTGYAERFGIKASDNYLLPTPLGHAVGALTAQSISLHSGCRITVIDRFSPSRWWRDVHDSEATFSILFPAQLNLLMELEADAPGAGETTFRLAITHAWHEAFRQRFGVEIGLCWAMTETGAVGAGSEPAYDGSKGEGFIGAPWPATEIATFDEDYNRLPAGSRGEVCLRHRHVMLGYLDDAGNTEKSLVDGWVRSGDQGTINEDGHLIFHGRIKNVIKRSGENIGAEEVESVLDALPGVAESLVFGVPDPMRTEEVCALVVLKEGAAVEEHEIRSQAAESLVRWKLPRYIAVSFESLPRLSNGKPDRQAVKASIKIEETWDSANSATDTKVV